jgi:hypothetical protein
MRATARANWQDPEFRKRNADAVRANWQDPEFRKRQADAVRAAKESILAWCPPELRDDYRLLVRHLGADEAREAILHQMQREQGIAICPQCERRIDDPCAASCSMIGCPLAIEDAA